MEVNPSMVLNIVLVSFLLTAIFCGTTTSRVGEYDPWIDYNDDGKIDHKDLLQLAAVYGTSGDPTKNVAVESIFPQKLILRGIGLMTPNRPDPDRPTPLLIDQNTPYPASITSRYTGNTLILPSNWTMVYDNRFEYDVPPLMDYQIQGETIATVECSFEVEFLDTTTVELNFTLFLEKKDALGNVTTLKRKHRIWSYSKTGGTLSSGINNGFIFSFETPYTIKRNKRLSLRLLVTARSTRHRAAELSKFWHHLSYNDNFRFGVVIPITPSY